MKYVHSRLVAEIIMYSLGGGISFWLTFGILVFFTDIVGLHYTFSLVLGYLIGFSFNFWFQDRITFKEEVFTNKKFALFFVIQFCGLVLLQAFTILFTEQFHIFYKISFFIASGVGAVVTFIASKVFVFRGKQRIVS